MVTWFTERRPSQAYWLTQSTLLKPNLLLLTQSTPANHLYYSWHRVPLMPTLLLLTQSALQANSITPDTEYLCQFHFSSHRVLLKPTSDTEYSSNDSPPLDAFKNKYFICFLALLKYFYHKLSSTYWCSAVTEKFLQTYNSISYFQ